MGFGFAVPYFKFSCRYVVASPWSILSLGWTTRKGGFPYPLYSQTDTNWIHLKIWYFKGTVSACIRLWRFACLTVPLLYHRFGDLSRGFWKVFKKLFNLFSMLNLWYFQGTNSFASAHLFGVACFTVTSLYHLFGGLSIPFWNFFKNFLSVFFGVFGWIRAKRFEALNRAVKGVCYWVWFYPCEALALIIERFRAFKGRIIAKRGEAIQKRREWKKRETETEKGRRMLWIWRRLYFMYIMNKYNIYALIKMRLYMLLF